MRAEDVRITIDREYFLWNESDEVTRFFFKLLHEREKIFNEEALKKMARFYTDDAERIHEAYVTVSKNRSPIRKGETMDAIVSMFFEGTSSCHRISFYLNDYDCSRISSANRKLIRDKAKITRYSLVESMSKAG